MRSNKKNVLDMTSGPVTGKLLTFVLPVLASNLLQHLYSAADRAIVGRVAVNGDFALAAVGSTGPAITLILNLFMGFALGANVICSNLRGAAKTKELRRAMHTSILLAAVCGVFLTTVGVLLAKPFLQLMQSPESVIESATLYMRIYFVGVPFSLLLNFGSSILRAHGDSKRPMLILAVSGLVNVGLNLVFVVFFGMDVDGVAWATVISQVIAAVCVLRILFKPDGDYGLNLKELKIHRREMTDIARMGIPAGLNGALFSISNVIIQSSVNSLGDIVMAGSAAAEGITGLTYQILAAFYTACINFGGQCYGAGKYKRIDKVVGRSLLFCSGMIAVLAAVATVFPNVFLGLFTDNPLVMKAAYPKLIILCWGYILYGATEIFLGASRGMRRSAIPTLLNVFGICAPRLIWVFVVFPMNPTFDFLHLCYPISWIISTIFQGFYYLHTRRKLDREEEIAKTATA